MEGKREEEAEREKDKGVRKREREKGGRESEGEEGRAKIRGDGMRGGRWDEREEMKGGKNYIREGRRRKRTKTTAAKLISLQNRHHSLKKKVNHSSGLSSTEVTSLTPPCYLLSL